MNNIERLYRTISSAGIPIDGVSGQQGSVRIDFSPSATSQNVSDANAIVASFDWSASAHAAYEESLEADLKTARDQASSAIAAIDGYLAIADSATNVQVRDEVKKIDQRQKVIIKGLLRIIQRLWRS